MRFADYVLIFGEVSPPNKVCHHCIEMHVLRIHNNYIKIFYNGLARFRKSDRVIKDQFKVTKMNVCVPE